MLAWSSRQTLDYSSISFSSATSNQTTLYLRVNGSNHAFLTVLALRAVKPDGLVIGDANSVGKKLRCRVCRSARGHEPRIECIGLVGHDVLDRYARVIEGRLNDRVVLLDVRRSLL
jgi:hypothetical protein